MGSGLTEMHIPATVNKIGDDAFNGCTHLETVKFEEGIKYIGEYAFADTYSLNYVVLPLSSEYVGEAVFARSGMTTLYYIGNFPPESWHMDWSIDFGGSLYCNYIECPEGDVNQDGKVDMFDYLNVKSAYFTNPDLSDREFLLLDVNKDGKIDMFDYIQVKQICFA